MAYIKLPLGIKVALEFDLAGKVVVNIYHVTTTDPITSVKLTTIAQAFLDWWVASMAASFSQDVSVIGASCLNLDVENGEKIYVPETPPVPGLIAASALSNNVACVVTLDTDKTGRSFQGRTYLAGIGEHEVQGNTIDTTRVTALLVGMIQLDADLAVLNTSMVVASFVTAGAPRAEGVPTRITAYSMNNRVDTQRRRLPKA